MPADMLQPNRPRRLLAIDGGGLLGLLPAEALILIEQQLNQLTGAEEPLCDRFDLIGGTSTGAILAAGLALGLKAMDLRDFYLKFGSEIFTKCWLPVRFWHSYPSAPLEKHLKEVFGAATTLGSDRLRTQIMVVTKNATLGNDWFFTNNPKSKFFKNNSALPLWQVVRASTAAPTERAAAMRSSISSRVQACRSGLIGVVAGSTGALNNKPPGSSICVQ